MDSGIAETLQLVVLGVVGLDLGVERAYSLISIRRANRTNGEMNGTLGRLDDHLEKHEAAAATRHSEFVRLIGDLREVLGELKGRLR